MKNDISIIKLPGDANCAVVFPGGVLFGLNANQEDIQTLVQEATEITLLQDLDIEIEGDNASLAVIPTFNCTLACKYCYARGGETREVILAESVYTALRAIKNDHNNLKLSLVGGGEPLMYFDRVKDLVTLAQELYTHVDLSVVTNGTFDIHVVDWLIENNVSVRLSYDGVMHDKQRYYPDGSDSSVKVVGNLKAIIEGGIDPIVQCIITSQGLNTMRETIDLLCSYNVKTVKFEPVLSTDVSRATKDMEPNPKMYAKTLLDIIKYVADNNLDITIDTGYFSEPSTDYYCGMPTGNKILTPAGYITTCVEVARITDPYSSYMLVGEVKENRVLFNKDKINFLSTLHYDNQKGGCIECNLRLFCHGGCPMANIWRNGFPLRKSRYTCEIEHALIPPLLLMIAENEKIAEVIMENPDIRRY